MKSFAERVVDQNRHRDRTLLVDREGWTRKQWVDDVRAVMADPDGSARSLLDQHVWALLAEIDELKGAADRASW